VKAEGDGDEAGGRSEQSAVGIRLEGGRGGTGPSFLAAVGFVAPNTESERQQYSISTAAIVSQNVTIKQLAEAAA
jgi:hypothetical protein